MRLLRVPPPRPPVKISNRIATLWQGSITMETPMLFAVGFIYVFTIGGFAGLVLAIAH